MSASSSLLEARADQSFILFHRSFASWLTPCQSLGRFSVECLLDCETEQAWCLLSEVAACRMYESGPLLHQPPYLFRPLFSQRDHRIWRTHAPLQSLDTVGANQPRFESFEVHLESGPGNIVADARALISVVQDNLPINARVCLTDWPGLSLSFPVRHINVHLLSGQFQVETGPVLLPTKRRAQTADIAVGFIAFNSFGACEFIAYEVQEIAGVRLRVLGISQCYSASIQLIIPERRLIEKVKEQRR